MPNMTNCILKKTTRLKQLIQSPTLNFIMEAHNGLSAKIVEQTGFEAIWASSLSISASFGVRDTNEASWTQIVEVIEFMADATTVPILLDGDTGYGNFNNARRLVKKCEQRGIAGVCIEDKLFPKANSLLEGKKQPLADQDEFCGKIKAAKDAQQDPDFIVVARVEAFIAGWGLQEALTRAEAYRQAGADAVLIHSKEKSASEIEAFMAEWNQRLPVIIVPTNYYTTPTETFRRLGVSTVIWANHSIRSCMGAIQKTTQQIYKEESLTMIEPHIPTVQSLFKLVDMQELKIAEKMYLPESEEPVKALILAASRGTALGDLTASKPKTLLPIKGVPILDHQIQLFHNLQIQNISVVRGYKKSSISIPNIHMIDNDQHEETKDLYSLFLAHAILKGPLVIAYGDIMYKRYAIDYLMQSAGDIKILVDPTLHENDTLKDLVSCSTPFTNDFYSEDVLLKDIDFTSTLTDTHGQWAGVVVTTEKGTQILRDQLDILAQQPNFKTLSVTHLLKSLLLSNSVHVVYIKGGWIGVNEARDYEAAKAFI